MSPSQSNSRYWVNDICYPYVNENNTDVILRDRRKDIFKNVTFCPTGYTYTGINYTTSQAICDNEMLYEVEGAQSE